MNVQNTHITHKKVLFLLFTTLFLDMLCVGILIPVLPQLFGNPSSSSYILSAHTPIRTGYVLLGVLTALFALCRMVAAPILGQLADIYGRRPVLRISILGTAISYFLLAFGIFTKSLFLVFFARFLDGITSGNISTIQAMIGDTSTEKDRGKNFGMIGLAFSLGFILGPAIGGFLSDTSIASWFSGWLPFIFAGIIGLVNTYFVYMIVPETLKNRDYKIQAPKNIQYFLRDIKWYRFVENLKKGFSQKEMQVLYTTSFLYSAGFTLYTSFFAVFLVKNLGSTEKGVGIYFSYIGICIFLAQFFIVRKYMAYKKESWVVPRALFALGLCVLVYSYTDSFFIIYIIAPLFALANEFSLTSINGLLSKKAAEKQGIVFGINASMTSLAQALSPLIASVIAIVLSPSASIGAAGILLCISAYYFYTKNLEKEI